MFQSLQILVVYTKHFDPALTFDTCLLINLYFDSDGVKFSIFQV